MGYLLTEIVVYLVIAGLIGFAFGWAVKAGALDKYFSKLIEVLKKVWALILGFFAKVKSYFSNLELFNKSTKTKETVKSDAKDSEKVSLLTKAKESLKASYLALTTSKKVVKEEVVKEEVAEVKAEVTSEKVAKEEVAKEEVKVEEVKVEEPIKEETKVEVTEEAVAEVMADSTKPVLFTEAPAEGQDKLSSLKGLGPVMEKKLNELGVYTFAQMASWNSEQELWIGTQLASPQKVTNAEWVKQAKELLEAK